MLENVQGQELVVVRGNFPYACVNKGHIKNAENHQ